MKIVLTGGAGFIGSCILKKLNDAGHNDIVVVDSLKTSPKWKNLVNKNFADYLDKEDFIRLVEQNTFGGCDIIIHMGACSSTTGNDADYYMRNNYDYTRKLALYSLQNKIRFIYASSGATYGDGALGFSDEDKVTPRLKPMNVYGFSKHLFDLWVLRHNLQAQFAGIKFFNVYGPNEYHKEDMRSLICRKFKSVVSEKKLGLFKSYRPDYGHGEQKRDFIYVKDAVDVVFHFIENPSKAGIYNVGSGKANTWNELARALFEALGMPANIEYIEMPEVLKDKYQYITEADISKLRRAGYKKEFTPLKEAVKDYVSYLKNDTHI